MRSSLFRIPQSSVIRPTQNCTDFRSHLTRRTHCIVTHVKRTVKSTEKHFFVSTGMERQSIQSRYRCYKRSSTVHLVVKYYSHGWRQPRMAPVKIFSGPMTPTFQINFSYLNSLRIYITRLCFLQLQQFLKNLMLWSCTAWQIHSNMKHAWKFSVYKRNTKFNWNMFRNFGD